MALLTACGVGAMSQVRLTESANGGERFALPGPIAVGAVIAPNIDLEVRGSGAPSMRMVSARPGVLAAEGHRLTGRAPGVAAVLITTEDGVVLDFVHLWVARASHIALHTMNANRERRGEIDDAVELVVGDSLVVTPVVYAGNQELSGSIDAVWTIDEPVAQVLHDGARQRRRLVASAPGRATVRVNALGLESSFDINVVQP